jgi:hypothetical protein
LDDVLILGSENGWSGVIRGGANIYCMMEIVVGEVVDGWIRYVDIELTNGDEFF